MLLHYYHLLDAYLDNNAGCYFGIADGGALSLQNDAAGIDAEDDNDVLE